VKSKNQMMKISVGMHQAKCLSLLLTGKSVGEAASILKIHPRTVEFHVQKLLAMVKS